MGLSNFISFLVSKSSDNAVRDDVLSACFARISVDRSTFTYNLPRVEMIDDSFCSVIVMSAIH